MTRMRMRSLLKRAYYKFLPGKTGELNTTADFWNETVTALCSEYWFNFQTIRELITTRLTGSADVTWFTQQILERKTPFGRILAFGDGYGMAAEAIQTRRDTSELVYFNLAAGEGKRCEETLEKVAMDKPYRFVQADANQFVYDRLGMFDTIIDVGAFHHLKNFETAFPRINGILKKDALLYIDEFVGPSKYNYSQRVLDIINDWLQTLPDSLVANRKPVKKADFISLWERCPDPSEGIRSGDLDQALMDNFRLLSCDDVGGTLLQPFFLTSYLSPCRLNITNWHNSPEGKEWAATLVHREEELLKTMEITSDYRDYVFTRK